jgi:hypothetical protein
VLKETVAVGSDVAVSLGIEVAVSVGSGLLVAVSLGVSAVDVAMATGAQAARRRLSK